jgi:mRNA interferase HigB
MIVITRTRLLDFSKQHPTSVEPLNRWYAIIKNADWSNFSDLKQLFPNADYVGNDRYVFNIKGNDFRLVLMIHFSTRTVYIKYIGTHEDYNKIECSKI